LIHSNDVICHTASNWVDVPAEAAFDYLTDGIQQGEWTLGSLNRAYVGEHPNGRLFVGRSIMDGQACYVVPRPDRNELVCFYDVGVGDGAPEKLTTGNVFLRVIPGSNWGGTAEQCIVTLAIWRPKNVDDLTWAQECQMFNAEIFILKGRLEHRFDLEQPVVTPGYEPTTTV
jgi:hypothetical protein